MKLFGKYILFLCLLVGSHLLVAQEEDTTEFKKFKVSTGNIKPRSIGESPHHVKVITHDVIVRQGAVNLSDVLQQQINIRVGNDNILGSSLSLQGITGQNIKILLDGIPITGRENGNIDLSQLNLDNIERIEIIEGPLSVIYGTDALGGVINLVSKSILLSDSKPVVTKASSYIESSRKYNFGGGVILKVNNVDFAANLNRNFFAGFNPDKSTRIMVWKPKQQVFGNFGILSQTKKLKVRFKTDIFSEKLEDRGYPIINHVEAYAYDKYYLTNRNINSLHLEYKIDDYSFVNTQSSFSFYQRDKITYRKDLTLSSNNMQVVPSQDANSSNSFLNFMSRGSYNDLHYARFNYQIGYDINFNSAFGTKIEADKGRMNDFAFYACAEFIPVKNLIVKPGFRASYNTRYSAPFIPSIQLKYKLRKFNFRYAYGRGFRAPSLKELYLYFVDYDHNIVGNPELLAELSENHLAGISYEAEYSKDVTVTATQNVFYNKIYNQIALVSLNPLELKYTYGNVDEFRSLGANFSTEIRYRNWKWMTGVSYIGIYNNAFDMLGKSKFNYSPELNLRASYRIKHPDKESTYISIFAKYNGRVLGYALNDTRSIVTTYSEPFTMVDFSVNRRFRKKLTITTGVKNMLNVVNIRSTGVSTSFHSTGTNSMPVSVGRTVFLQLALNI